MNQSILFSDTQTVDETLKQVIFPAQQAGMLIECVISFDKLSELSGQDIGEDKQALQLFSEYRFDIEELAEALIEDENYNALNQIEIT